MAQDPDEDRIRLKAHELWVADGCPNGRDVDHWEQAREIIAIKDSQSSTLLPRDTGAGEPVESSAIAQSYGDVPNLTDQGGHDLTDVSREPGAVAPPFESPKTVGEIEAAMPPKPAPAGSGGKAGPQTVAKLTAKNDAPVRTGKPDAMKKKKR